MAGSDRDDYKNLLSFCELYHGRFDISEATFLFDRFHNNIQDVINFVLSSESAEVRRVIDEERQTWTQVLRPEKRQGLATKIETIRQRPSIIDRARLGEIDVTYRLFACGPCDNVWWRRVPDRKQVSQCNRCHVRYDPVPRAQEWGWAEFRCHNCGHEFGGYCGVWCTSPCYQCSVAVKPIRIIPPTNTGRQRRTNNTHRCNAHDCDCRVPTIIPPLYDPAGSATYQHSMRLLQYGGGAGGVTSGAVPVALLGDHGPAGGGGGMGLSPGAAAEGTDLNVADIPVEEAEVSLPDICVYPSSRRARGLPVVIVPSSTHDSTGSTVNTFLPQRDLAKTYETIPMPTIDED